MQEASIYHSTVMYLWRGLWVCGMLLYNLASYFPVSIMEYFVWKLVFWKESLLAIMQSSESTALQDSVPMVGSFIWISQSEMENSVNSCYFEPFRKEKKKALAFWFFDLTVGMNYWRGAA